MRFKICVRLMGTKVNNETFREIAEMLSLFYFKKGVLCEKTRTNKTRVKRNKRKNKRYRRKTKATKKSRTKDIKTRHIEKKKRKKEPIG